MEFKIYLQEAWKTHASNARGVADQFSSGIQLMKEPTDVEAMARLVTHVHGDHLQSWMDGRKLLKDLSAHALAQSASVQKSLALFEAVLSQAGGDEIDTSQFSPSERVRICSMVATCLVEADEIERASQFLNRAVQGAVELGDQGDPVMKNVAMAGNNIAASLEASKQRSSEADKLMLRAAEVGRVYWEKAGGWLEVERAEYRLAKTQLALGDWSKASSHAKVGLEICDANKAPALERFFMWELFALIGHRSSNQKILSESLDMITAEFENLDPADKEWCGPIRNELMALK